MNEELTQIIDTLAQKLGVASQFVITELSKWKIANHLVWLVIGIILLFIAYKIFMAGVNKCKEYNKKVDEDYEKQVEDAKIHGRSLDFICRASYDDMFEDEEYCPYWGVSAIFMLISIPMVIYGIFVIPWIIAPTGSTIAYLLEVLK